MSRATTRETVSQTDETAGQKVFFNHLLLDNIFFFLTRSDLAPCPVLQQSAFELAVKHLYRYPCTPGVSNLINVNSWCPLVGVDLMVCIE